MMKEGQGELIELYKRLRNISSEIYDIKCKLSTNTAFKEKENWNEKLNGLTCIHEWIYHETRWF